MIPYWEVPRDIETGQPYRRNSDEDVILPSLYYSYLAAPGVPNPYAFMVLMEEVKKLQSWKRFARSLAQLRERFFTSDPEPTGQALPQATAHQYGINLPLKDECLADMLEEVHRFKWIEAERAGRDIWRERDPQDPDSVAFKEWFRQHFGAWYLSRQSRRLAR